MAARRLGRIAEVHSRRGGEGCFRGPLRPPDVRRLGRYRCPELEALFCCRVSSSSSSLLPAAWSSRILLLLRLCTHLSCVSPCRPIFQAAVVAYYIHPEIGEYCSVHAGQTDYSAA